MDTWQALLEKWLPFVKEEASRLHRRYHLSKEDGEDFFSTLALKLAENEGRILREWKGRGTLATYLRAVAGRAFQDYLRSLWGRYRESAEAGKLGAVAAQLEQLVCRDGFSRDEAIRFLRLNHHVDASEAELLQLAADLPPRLRRTFEDDSGLEAVAGREPTPEERALGRVSNEELRRVRASLSRAIATLPKLDQVILRLTVKRKRKPSRLAPRLGLDQATVYRRRSSALARVHTCMEADGISADLIRRILAEGAGGGDA